MVAVGNGSSVGGGAELTPEATPEDGRVDVMISRAVGPLERFDVRRPARLRAPPPGATRRPTCAARSVSVSGGRSGVSADGEIYGPERQRTWHVEPAAYSMVLPARRARPPEPRRAGHSQPRRAASTPAWKRESAPSSMSRSATRRRTVRRLMPERAGDLLVLGAGGELLQQEPAQVGAGLAAVQLGHRARPAPTSARRAASAPRPARAGGPASRGSSAKPSGSGSTAWVVPMMNIRVGSSGSTRICSPTSARATQRAPGASCRARDRVDRPGPAARRDRLADHRRASRPRAGSATGRGASQSRSPLLCAISARDQRHRLAAGADLAVDRLGRRATSPGAGPGRAAR